MRPPLISSTPSTTPHWFLALSRRLAGLWLASLMTTALAAPARQTHLSIAGDEFRINGQPTYAGRTWQGHKVEGLLLNARLVQGIFDDRNPTTFQQWAYPDTGTWDPERNTREFLAAMPDWRRHGLLAFTINLQGGSPQGYSQDQPWHNSALEADGSLRADYLGRLERILDQADALGMGVILGYFYFGQDQRIQDEAAVVRAVDNTTRWLLDRGYRNVLVEINNECNVAYDHPILQPGRVHELIERVKAASRDGPRLLVSTSYGGGTIPSEKVARASDFLLLHGNGVSNPDRIAAMVRQTRQVPGYTPKPILFNEDDHFDFDKPRNNFTAAVGEYAGWGYFDFRMKNEGFVEGYQSVPVDWTISSVRKRGFFGLLREMTGAAASVRPVGEVRVTETNYHGWNGSLLMSNGKAEVVIVPAIARVMQFRFAGETEGPFWEKRELAGRPADPKGSVWDNFGGDKAWPAPQADWPKVTARGWPPPQAFDSTPVTARVEGTEVSLTSAVDPHYGIRVHRRVRLDASTPTLSITTTFEKVEGQPVKAGVWVITQLGDPHAVFVPVPRDSTNAGGYHLQSDRPPDALEVKDGLISLKRGSRRATKIGNDAGTLVWVGPKHVVRIDSTRAAGSEYPDQGCSVEVYTNQDPDAYVELETLGPLHTLKAGDRVERTNVYRLWPRSDREPSAEARAILGL